MAKNKEEIVLTAIRAWKEKDKSNEFWFKAIVEGAYNSGYTKAKQESADAVEELQLYVDLYKDLTEKGEKVAREVIDKYPKWIPVTERLPDHHGHYLAHIIAGEYQQVSWDEIAYFDGNAFQWEHSSEEYPEKLTHWMPLPEPPEKESES